MENQQQNNRLIILAVIVILTLLSYATSYAFFYGRYFPDGGPVSKQDKLSNKTYNTDDIYNYREANLYASYFVGFDTLTDRGVSDGDLQYIQDVVLNFTMYDQKIYNGKISYVDGSFKRDGVSGIEPKYGFSFGINDKHVHDVSVSSSILTKDITISISNPQGIKEFTKTFHEYSTTD